MALDPERPIEQTLHEAARKRREMAGEPFALHPVDRRLLQAEVARVHPRQGSGLFRFDVPRLLPRLAWSFGIVAVLAFAVWQFLPGPSPPVGPVAMGKSVSHPEIGPASTAAPAGSVLSETASEGSSQVLASARVRQVVQSRSREEVGETAPSLAAADAMKETETKAPVGAPNREQLPKDVAELKQVIPPPSAPTMELFRRRYATSTAPLGAATADSSPDRSLTGSRSATPAKAGADAFVPADPAASSLPLAKSPNKLVQSFSRPVLFDSEDKKLDAANSILRSFTVEMGSSRIRIEDADRSIYSGYLEQASRMDALSAASGLRKEPVDKAAQPVLPGTNLLQQAFSFRVVGTNLTSKEKVVFSGFLLPAGTNSAGAATGMLRSFKIEGAASVGTRPAIQIRAEPASR